MELPVLIERLPDGLRYAARLGEPFNLTVEGTTPDEAQALLTSALQGRLQQGAELRAIVVRPTAPAQPKGGWLPDDELTQEWREAIQSYRNECDEADQRRLADGPSQDQRAS